MFYQKRPHAGRRNHPLAAMEWSHLLLHDAVCSEHVTMHHAAEWTIPLKTEPYAFYYVW